MTIDWLNETTIIEQNYHTYLDIPNPLDLLKVLLFDSLKETSFGLKSACNVTLFNLVTFYQWALIPSVIATIIISFTTKRKNIAPNFLNGRPGFVHPINILELRAIRFSFSLAFGMSAIFCFQIFSNQIGVTSSMIQVSNITSFLKYSKWAPPLFKIADVLIYGLLMLPIYCAISRKSKISYFLGALFSWILIAENILEILYSECKMYDLVFGKNISILIVSLSKLGSLFCMIGLGIIFPYRFMELILGRKSLLTIKEEKEDEYMKNYVVDLLQIKRVFKRDPNGLLIAEIAKEAIAWIKSKRKRGFRFSSRIVSTYVIVAIMLYMIVFEFVIESVTTIRLVDKILTTLPKIPPLDTVLKYLQVIRWCVYMSISMAGLWNAVCIPVMMINYRNHILSLYTGDFGSIPKKTEKTTKSASFLLVSAVRYTGYQIAFTLVGFIIQAIVFFLVSIFVAFVVFEPINGTVREFFVSLAETYWSLAVVSALLIASQYAMTYFVFLPSGTNVLAINNRSAFFTWAYFSFYFNAFWGILSCILRLVKIIVITILFIHRIDWPLMSKFFDFMDDGYYSYVGHLYIEYSYTHPILRTFINLMRECAEIRDKNPSERYLRKHRQSNINCLDVVSVSMINVTRNNSDFNLSELIRIESLKTAREIRARTRWFLAFTLINNPGFIIQRYHKICETEERRQRTMENSSIQIERKMTQEYIEDDYTSYYSSVRSNGIRQTSLSTTTAIKNLRNELRTGSINGTFKLRNHSVVTMDTEL